MLAKQILIRTARARSNTDATANHQGRPQLGKLDRTIPDVTRFIRDKRVLDFGCGNGYEAVALAESGAREVVGLDIQPALLAHARELADRYRLTERISFVGRLEDTERFDTIVSCNSFEHFGDPRAILREMRHHLKPGGAVIISFGPPWYAPYGAHMMHWCPIPWVHLLFSERGSCVFAAVSHRMERSATRSARVASTE